MVDLQQYEEYWSGITERIPQIKKVVPVTFDPDMGALVQGLNYRRCYSSSQAPKENPRMWTTCWN